MVKSPELAPVNVFPAKVIVEPLALFSRKGPLFCGVPNVTVPKEYDVGAMETAEKAKGQAISSNTAKTVERHMSRIVDAVLVL